MVDLDLSFAHSYSVEEIPELPGTGKPGSSPLYFPRPKARPEHDGIWLTLHPAIGTPWTGVFALGYAPPPAISRVLSTPDPGRICVISSGAAYVVKADEPEVWETLDLMPVLEARPIPEHSLLVLSDFTRLIALGRNQVVWRSPRVCWDDLRILNVSNEVIEGVGWDPVNSCDSPFAVDIRTGKSLLDPPKSVEGIPVW